MTSSGLSSLQGRFLSTDFSLVHLCRAFRAGVRQAEYSRLVDAIRRREVTTTSDGHLLLPAGLQWPVATNHILFVRRYYAPLFENVLRRCLPAEDPIDHRIIVTGQPGIGKSVFGCVWFGRVVRIRLRPGVAAVRTVLSLVGSQVVRDLPAAHRRN